MKISLIVHLTQRARLVERHLLESISRQNQEVISVQVYTEFELDKSLILDEWAVEKVDEGIPEREIWSQGLASAEGTHLCFVTADSFFEAHYFEKVARYLEQHPEYLAYVSPVSFLDNHLYALPTKKGLPRGDYRSWIGHILKGTLSLPLSAFILEKGTLSPETFSEPRPFDFETAFLIDWLVSNQAFIAGQYHGVNYVTSEEWLKKEGASPDGFKLLLEHCMDAHSIEELVPQSAHYPKVPKTLSSHSFIHTLLLDRGFQALADAFAKEHQASLSLGALKRVLWLEIAEVPTEKSALRALLEKGYAPVILRVDTSESYPEPFCSYVYKSGVLIVTLKGLPIQEIEKSRHSASPVLIDKVKELLDDLQPVLVHGFSFEYYSYHIVSTVRGYNIPFYFHYSDQSSLHDQELLRRPDAEELWDGKTYSSVKTHHGRVFAALKNQVVKIMTPPEHYKRLLSSGLPKSKLFKLKDPRHVVLAYQEAPLLYNSNLTLPTLPTAYERMNGEPLPVYREEDLPLFEEAQHIGYIGQQPLEFLRFLKSKSASAMAVSPFPSLVKSAQKEGLDLRLGDAKVLSKNPGAFDLLYSAFDFGRQSDRALLTWLEELTLSLKKSGKLVLRVFAADAMPSLWLDESLRRPYPVAVLKCLLEHANFQVLESHTTEGDWSEHRIVAQLMDPALPLSTYPVYTSDYASYWKMQSLEVECSNEQRMLIAGSVILNNWKIFRGQAKQVVGLSQSMDELKYFERKKFAPHTLRYSNHLLKSLAKGKALFDCILLQGVVETLYPEELVHCLDLCRKKMKAEGTLYIQSMKLDSGLFWQNALNKRPYPNLKVLLEERGFDVVAHETLEGHCNYTCKRVEVPEKALKVPGMPEDLKKLLASQEHKVLINDLKTLLKLSNESCDFLILNQVMESVNPSLFRLFLDRLHLKLKAHGQCVIFVRKDLDWQSNTHSRPLNVDLFKWLLHQHGFHMNAFEETDDHWIWVGAKHLDLRETPTLPIELAWEGSCFGGRSTDVFYRYILNTLQKDKAFDINIWSQETLEKQQFLADPILYSRHFSGSNRPRIAIQALEEIQLGAPDHMGHWVALLTDWINTPGEDWVVQANRDLDQVWVTHDDYREHLVAEGVLPNKIAIVPTLVDAKLFHPELRPWRFGSQKHFKILFSGKGDKGSGLDLLLRSYFRVFSADDNTVLILNLEDDQEKTKAWIQRQKEKKANLPEVEFVSQRPDMNQLAHIIQGCDVLVSPFRRLANDILLKAAKACAKPVVLTQSPTTEKLFSASSAYFVPAEVTAQGREPNIEFLATLLRQIYLFPEELEMKGQSAREEHHIEEASAEGGIAKQLHALVASPVFRLQRESIVTRQLTQAFKAFDKEDYAATVELMEYVLKIEPHQPNVSYNLGVAYMMLSRYEEALTFLQKSLKEGEASADLCYAMGTTLRHLGDHETADQFHAKAREIDPELFAQTT